ncbi:winged helix-turn-helix transcriptional regulator [Micromonospora sp. CA-244673]|uniref:winged helix-turn-helix transcriptional regulator n=1 Tax=Micromonospora sp. CA-244673 TaxID=3239958 RepID=UPI003D8F3F35
MDRPEMAALDLFGRRWTLRIIWELGNEPLGFRLLQRRCDCMSSSVLRQRLTELQEARLAEVLCNGNYTLTPLGHDDREALRPVIEWSRGRAAELADTPPTASEATASATGSDSGPRARHLKFSARNHRTGDHGA